MSDIDDFLAEIDDNSPFLNLQDGEPKVGNFVKATLVDDSFNKGEKTMEYTLKVGDMNKTFNSKSGQLARLFKGVKKGDEVQIVRTGTAFDTKWYVKKTDEEEEK